MSPTTSVESQWTRLGVSFFCAPSSRTPDLERLLLATAPAIPENPRLMPLVATWLVDFGGYVAKHRLKHLISSEMAAHDQPALGLLLESAIRHGAPRDLAMASRACSRAATPRPLVALYRETTGLATIAEKTASPLARKWRVWYPDFDLKRDAIRPVSWLLGKNPSFHARIVRKGDLRCSILETLRWDTNGVVDSESELARLSGATRTAVRKALAALVREGEVTVGANATNRRDHPVALRLVA